MNLLHLIQQVETILYQTQSLGLVFKRDDLQPRGCGFKSWSQILNGMRAKPSFTLNIITETKLNKHNFKNGIRQALDNCRETLVKTPMRGCTRLNEGLRWLRVTLPNHCSSLQLEGQFFDTINHPRSWRVIKKNHAQPFA